MGNAEIESAAQHGARVFEIVHAAEVVPEPERNRGKFNAAAAAATVLHGIVAMTVGDVHDCSPEAASNCKAQSYFS